ncbi:unnamed protein product [Vitrella brassicaformis CCMP3155]|uniref:Uncharacterized protein n=1 Tax=Vitrella brassicaformis (strain CCMP3155) TaxID=1169540 RepID=A0A0G4F7N9_VITBC|nr:unnamed protein product [Vitrella brassicaformis CCMP3155]|eukprot:CEM08026.1 unnamed protein product [Vitrella brassicaformis CCMP3155]
MDRDEHDDEVCGGADDDDHEDMALAEEPAAAGDGQLDHQEYDVTGILDEVAESLWMQLQRVEQLKAQAQGLAAVRAACDAEQW